MQPPMNGDKPNGTSQATPLGEETEPVAIVGLSLRFPEEATSPDKFWQILQEGRSVMTEVPPDRYNINGFYHPDHSRNDTLSGRGAHFMKGDVAAFDAPFFSMSPAEVISMDPQQRLLLETTYRALENAGIPMENAAGSQTSVYVGALGVDYSRFFEADEEVLATYRATGTNGAILSNRLSWFYDLRGPSMTIETACSGSLIALHLACQSIRNKESKMSLVCGSQLHLEPMTSAISLSTLKFMSPDSLCHSFDDRANGYVKGEGFGVLVLKPLSDALADGDVIRAVIRGTATNQDGRTAGISQPSGAAQERVIREAYRSGGIGLSETRLFEAHAPGTTLGDPIEASAIKSVFREHRSLEDPLHIGAVKANIGHLEATAGIASVIKTILSLERGLIPPIAGLNNINPKIPGKEWHLNFPTAALPWPTDGLRRASVNAFGYGGANAHAVLDDAYNYLREHGLKGQHATVAKPPAITPDGTTLSNGHSNGHTNGHSNGYVNGHSNGHSNGASKESEKAPHIFVWSASDSGGIERFGSAYKEYLSELDTHEISADYMRNVAYTLSNRRSLLPWKSAIVAESLEDLKTKLESIPKPVRSSIGPRVQFVFTGQGAQWAQMGIDLLQFPQFKDSVEQADAHIKSLGSQWSLIEELQKPAESSSIDNPALAQPLSTALQVGLVELLSAWGISPWGVVGHSSGEIAAAFCVGAISRESAWSIAYFRGLLAARIAETQTENRGAMMAVGLSEEQLKPYFNQIAQLHGEGSLSVGCINSATNSTVTGLEKSIDELKAQLDEKSVFARKLQIPVAYHSSHMQSVAEEYRTLLQGISPPDNFVAKGSHSPFFSTVKGRPIAIQELSNPDYWVANLVSPVRFSGAIGELALASTEDRSAKHSEHYIEIGPHAAMQRPIKDNVLESEDMKYSSTMRRNAPAAWSLAQLVGDLWVEGYPVKIDTFNGHGSKEPASIAVDLPEYPFNHSQTYWLESRLFKNYRLREHIRHELFGIASNDWNPSEPKFRFTIRSSDLPWVLDHKLNGSIVYPAGGLAVIAIEAARYLAKPEVAVKGFRLRHVTISSPLVIPETPEGIESQILLRPQKNTRTTGLQSIESREFSVFVYSNNEWREVCAGSILTEYEEDSEDVFCGDDKSLDRAYYQELYQKALASCSATTTETAFYESANKAGFEFGPTFNTLHSIAFDPETDQAAAFLLPDEWKTKVSEKVANIQSHVIHPTTLDGIFQVGTAATTKGGTAVNSSSAPTHLRDLWVSSDLLSRTSSTKLEAFAETTLQATRETDVNIVALDAETGEPLVVVDGYRLTAVSMLNYVPSKKRNIFYRQDWKPDVSYLSRAQKEQYCLEKEKMPIEWATSKHIVSLYYLSKMLRELEEQKFNTSVPHFVKYLAWVRRHFENLGQDNPLLQTPWKEIFEDETRREQYLEEFAAGGRVEKSIVDFCQHLTSIVTEEVNPLDLLFNQGIATDFYSDEMFRVSARRMAAFVDLLAHKNSGMEILEIGAGTGSGTEPILSVLKEQGTIEGVTPRYSKYTFTDISPSFFEKAQAHFSDHADRMAFQMLDIERDPADQGFELAKYDLVIAVNVLHATKCVSDTLKHARSLLKPGGHLILMEPTDKEDPLLNGIWGTLPGWWRSEEEDRSWCPLYSQAEWDSYIKQTGYTGLEAAITAFPGPENHILSILATQRSSTEVAELPLPKKLLVAAETELQKKVADEITSQLKLKGLSDVAIATPDLIFEQKLQGDACLSLLDFGVSFLSTMNDRKFSTLKKIIEASEKLYWVTSGAGETATSPENAMSAGFSRAIMLEHPGLLMANIDVDEKSESAVKTITDLLENSFGVSQIEDWEDNYRENNGTILIPRVVEANDVNEHVYRQTGKLAIEQREVGKEPTEALEVKFTPGQLDSFRFVRGQAPSLPLEEDEVEVEVKATPLNFADVMCVLGQVAYTYIGHDYAGVVRRTGSAVKGLAPGDRVCGVAPGTFKTYVRNKQHTIFPIPEHLGYGEVWPAVWLPALYGIRHLGRLREGESVLIHAAAGAVGQAAIQLAQMVCADVFVTVSTPEKKKLLQDLYGIPDNRFFSSRKLSFGKQIMRATKGRGVDVILNSTSGELLAETFRCIAPLGRFVEIGKRDIHTFQNLSMSPFAKNVSFSSLDMQTVYSLYPNVLGDLIQELKELLFSAKLKPPQPITQFSRGEFESAFRYLQTGTHTGKTVINWETEAEIPVVPTHDPEYFFDPKASYVIAGGLGGVGRSLARWLASRGAKHLILLSRSGAVSEEAMKLVSELTTDGVNVATPPCDVSKLDSLKAALDKCAITMPPAKGVIQGSMVLKDRLFDNMTAEEWQAVMDPKIAGTWNLHKLFPQDLDFFVILSTLGGMVGSKGQSQYNATATFQDAFARHRWSLGQKCISIDVGVLKSVGYVAEQARVAKRLATIGYTELDEKDLHSIVDWACHPARDPTSAWDTQILTALDRPSDILQRGHELIPYMKRPMYRHLQQTTGAVTQSTQSGSDERVDYEALLGAAANDEEAGVLIATELSKRLARALSVPEEDIDTSRPAHSFGVDSLVAVELRFWFQSEMKADLSVFDILENFSILDLSRLAASKSEYLHKE